MFVNVLKSVLLFSAVFCGLTQAQIDCTGLPDGPHGHGCESYTKCEGGVGTVVDCEDGFAFDDRTGDCERWSTVPPPCGSIDNDCTGLADGLYAIQAYDCLYFYTCQDQIFHGTKPCNPQSNEGDLRFDERLQSCNWRDQIPPPCGTAESKAAGSARRLFRPKV